MPATITFPKIRQVACGEGRTLLVTFTNGVCKQYDCTPLLQNEAFRPLQQEAFFRLAHADPHGYAVVWTDEVDLAESEIWINGAEVAPVSERRD